MLAFIIFYPILGVVLVFMIHSEIEFAHGGHLFFDTNSFNSQLENLTDLLLKPTCESISEFKTAHATPVQRMLFQPAELRLPTGRIKAFCGSETGLD